MKKITVRDLFDDPATVYADGDEVVLNTETALGGAILVFTPEDALDLASALKKAARKALKA